MLLLTVFLLLFIYDKTISVAKQTLGERSINLWNKKALKTETEKKLNTNGVIVNQRMRKKLFISPRGFRRNRRIKRQNKAKKQQGKLRKQRRKYIEKCKLHLKKRKIQEHEGRKRKKLSKNKTKKGHKKGRQRMSAWKQKRNILKQEVRKQKLVNKKRKRCHELMLKTTKARKMRGERKGRQEAGGVVGPHIMQCYCVSWRFIKKII